MGGAPHSVVRKPRCARRDNACTNGDEGKAVGATAGGFAVCSRARRTSGQGAARLNPYFNIGLAASLPAALVRRSFATLRYCCYRMPKGWIMVAKPSRMQLKT